MMRCIASTVGGAAVVEYGVEPRQLGGVGMPQPPRHLGALSESRAAALHLPAGHPYAKLHRTSLPDAADDFGRDRTARNSRYASSSDR